MVEFTEMQMETSDDLVQTFNRDGYTVIPNFLTENECDELKIACSRIMEQMKPEEHSTHVFHVGEKAVQSRDDYFLTSGDKIRFFFEPSAVDDSGKLLVPKELSVNKIGHALAWIDPAFRKVTFSQKVVGVCRALSLEDPRLVQSMYIFKNPGIGQKVSTHQDSTFLHVDPTSHLLGFWFALEDATEENGCLYFVPGSQNNQPKSRFIRNPDPSDGKLTIMEGEELKVPLITFKAAPVSKGSLVLIHGNVIHRSEQNTSSKSRHAYTFHLVDFHNAVYSPDNWLQPTEELPFPSVYQNGGN